MVGMQEVGSSVASRYWKHLTALAGLAIIVLGMVLGLVAGIASRDGGRDDRGQVPLGVPDPTEVVLAWDRSFRDADCTTFQETTTADFRAAYGQAEADYSTCAGFREGLEEIQVGKPRDFWRTYRIEVTHVSVDGSRARIETEESWEYLERGEVEQASDTYTYDLVLVDGSWLIDDASFLYDGAETPV